MVDKGLYKGWNEAAVDFCVSCFLLPAWRRSHSALQGVSRQNTEKTELSVFST